MNGRTFLLVLFELALVIAKLSYEGYKVYRILPNDKSQIDLIYELSHKAGYDMWSHGIVEGRHIDMMVSPEEQPNFERLMQTRMIDYSILSENVGDTVKREQNNQMRGSFSRSISGGADFSRFMRYQEIADYVLSLPQEYPQLCETEFVGKSFEGRDIVMIKISDGQGKKPVYLMEAGMHAREWAGPATVLFLINQLVENRTRSKEFLSKADFYIIPVANPDGYEYSHTSDRMWRKTRAEHFPCFGTDGNRNFGFHWAEAGSSSDACTDTFHGPVAFSEPETQALRDVGYKYRDKIVAYSAVHSYGSYLLYPWGYAKVLPDNWQQLDNCAKAAAAALENVFGTKYSVGTSATVLYEAAGGSDDWFLGELGIPFAYTFELPGTEEEGFNLPAYKIKTVALETIEAFKTIAGCAADYQKEFLGLAKQRNYGPPIPQRRRKNRHNNKIHKLKHKHHRRFIQQRI